MFNPQHTRSNSSALSAYVKGGLVANLGGLNHNEMESIPEDDNDLRESAFLPSRV